MAFQTARRNGSLKVWEVVPVPWTVNPTVQFGPIRDGQLEKPISFPVEIRLSLSAGANHQVNSLGMCNSVRRCPNDSRLRKSICGGVHPERQVRIGRLEHILTGAEAAFDGLLQRVSSRSDGVQSAGKFAYLRGTRGICCLRHSSPERSALFSRNQPRSAGQVARPLLGRLLGGGS